MTLQVMRRAGAVALLAVGAVHLQQYYGDDYRVLPTIGPLFLLNAISAGVVGLGLLLPIERLLKERIGERVVGLLALGAVAIAVGSLIALFIAETSILFGFSEDGYEHAGRDRDRCRGGDDRSPHAGGGGEPRPVVLGSRWRGPVA